MVLDSNKIQEIYHFIELFAFQQCNWSINILPHAGNVRAHTALCAGVRVFALIPAQ